MGCLVSRANKIKLAVLGFSEGNGHPFSFSAIINGFDAEGFDPDWWLIRDYLLCKPSNEFLSTEAEVVQAWTPDFALTERLCTSCRIPHSLKRYEDVENVDAVIIARDDWKDRQAILWHFLDRGIPVFCDKPLTGDRVEFGKLRNFLSQGLLYSGSGLRWAIEADPHRKGMREARFSAGFVINDLQRYGIHLLDLVVRAQASDVVEVSRLSRHTESFEFVFGNGHIFHLHCLGDLGKTFEIHYWNPEKRQFSVADNFTAFRRTLQRFLKMVRTGEAVDGEDTCRSIDALTRASLL